MNITKLKVNRLTEPVGYDLKTLHISYLVEEAAGKRQSSAKIEVSVKPDFSVIVYDSGMRADIRNTGFPLPVDLKPETRYYFRVTVLDETGEMAVSEPSFFETGKAGEWKADWITPAASKELQAVVFKSVFIEKPVCKARAYMTGLGVYEFSLNGEKQGDEVLLPGFCDYDTWIQYQTYELSLKQGENLFEIMLGNGWYKGVFGLRKKVENYGDRLAAIAEIKIWYEDGTVETVTTDPTWKARRSRVVESGIYPGETYDAALDTSEIFDTETINIAKEKLSERLSPPIRIQEKLIPVEVISTPAGETVLDLGQNMVGWLAFRTSAPLGHRLYFQFGEILQEGNFYRDNLRSAKAEFTYIADGNKDVWVRQHFTFYGFRYVKVSGWTGEVKAEDFRGLVIHSDMEETGSITTSDPLINRLVLNAKWGQKGNFLDVPTDCPQRDERCGWTGDAQIFSGTACFTMDTYAFYTKYGRDIYAEQCKLNGSVPDIVPITNYIQHASCGWADAAAVIPWNVYLHYGDTGILERQYQSMKAWVDYVKREDDQDGAKRLWMTGYHYADWLALDGNYPGGVYGATDPDMIASAYYYYSTTLVAKAAKILGNSEEEGYYAKLAGEIRDAFIREYFSVNGKLTIDTMTAYVLCLHFGLYPDNAKQRLADGLLNRLKRNRYHLNTGFLGTPFLCRVLSENGMNDLAYHLLMEKGYPGWLYEVIMGATTIWERWNSVLPDGKISGTEMNSLNHYSYGSIVEWMYRCMLGINPDEKQAGFKHFILSPKPNYQISSAKAVLHSAAGLIESEWEIKDGSLSFRFTVPYDASAEILLPDADCEEVTRILSGCEGISCIQQKENNVSFLACAGTYTIAYRPTVPYRKIYSINSPLEELEANPKTRKILEEEYYSIIGGMPFKKELYTLEEHLHGPFTSVPREQQKKINRLLMEVE